jgi:hypothetical protein
MISAEHDLAARRPVWSALSDLYLDTEYRSSVRMAARELAVSPYALDELREILLWEVHPVLAGNICATAGVWNRFDQVWLGECIVRGQRRARWLRPRALCGRRYARLLWRLLEPRIRRWREAGADAAFSHYPPRTAR